MWNLFSRSLQSMILYIIYWKTQPRPTFYPWTCPWPMTSIFFTSLCLTNNTCNQMKEKMHYNLLCMFFFIVIVFNLMGHNFARKYFKIVHLFPLKKFRLSEEKEDKAKTIKRKYFSWHNWLDSIITKASSIQ